MCIRDSSLLSTKRRVLKFPSAHRPPCSDRRHREQRAPPRTAPPKLHAVEFSYPNKLQAEDHESSQRKPPVPKLSILKTGRPKTVPAIRCPSEPLALGPKPPTSRPWAQRPATQRPAARKRPERPQLNTACSPRRAPEFGRLPSERFRSPERTPCPGCCAMVTSECVCGMSRKHRNTQVQVPAAVRPASELQKRLRDKVEHSRADDIEADLNGIAECLDTLKWIDEVKQLDATNCSSQVLSKVGVDSPTQSRKSGGNPYQRNPPDASGDQAEAWGECAVSSSEHPECEVKGLHRDTTIKL
eukprot:TRINITY_DN15373_c0_g1_i3.p1 TRINITY_DN15373_c0_g1~~TRINITY_DN15373_c0_g1_i3.p1  ORF type:complete len:300 (-),score=8.57 TRINITY_DN15373_c0_g1_i3:176-1075(-)